MANQRDAAAMELQKVKDRLAERDKALKAINTALADTPANVLAKMNTLKKQKQEEADSRRQVESALNTLRTEKRQQDQRLADLMRNGTTLVSRYRDLHALSLKLHEQLQAAGRGCEEPAGDSRAGHEAAGSHRAAGGQEFQRPCPLEPRRALALNAAHSK